MTKTLRIIKIFTLAFGLLISNFLQAKILIMTCCYNRPEFISWQAQAFEKFLKDDYEFVVFDDAPIESMSAQTQEVCNTLNIDCVRIPQSIHNDRKGPSVECADSIQYMLDIKGFDYPGIVVIVDSDMFLIRDFCVETFLEGYELAAHPQFRDSSNGLITYFLPNLMFFNMNLFHDKKSLSFNLGTINGIATDTAGFTYFYLRDHPNLKWFKTNCFYLLDEHSVSQCSCLHTFHQCSLMKSYNEMDSTNINQDSIDKLKNNSKLWDLISTKKFDCEFYVDYTFLHFRAGSNWYHMDNNSYSEKTKFLMEIMGELLNSD